MKWLVDQNVAERLNIVFDIDHTLIVAYDFPSTCQDRSLLLQQPDTHLLRLSGGHEMVLVVRQDVLKMIRFLSGFATLYVYSHGLREYILKILEILDPEELYFQQRDRRVLAPQDQME